MRPCGPCGFSNRQGAYIVAVISIVSYTLHLIAACLALNGGFETDMNEGQLYAFLSTTIILILLSVLLLLGIRYDSKWLIFPWLIMAIIADIGYCTAMVTYFVIVIVGPHNDKNVLAFISAMLTLCLVTYLLWVILLFFIDLFSSSGYERDRRVYQGLEDEDDVEAGKRTKGKPQNSEKRPTIMSKLIASDDIEY